LLCVTKTIEKGVKKCSGVITVVKIAYEYLDGLDNVIICETCNTIKFIPAIFFVRCKN